MRAYSRAVEMAMGGNQSKSRLLHDSSHFKDRSMSFVVNIMLRAWDDVVLVMPIPMVIISVLFECTTDNDICVSI